MTASRRRTGDRTPPTRTASWTSRVVLALLATVASLVALVAQPPAPQASHATDGELLAWVESHDAFDASAADASAAAFVGAQTGLSDVSPPLAATGTCRALLLSGLPAADSFGCELSKGAGDPTEVEPPRVVASSVPVPKRDTIVVASDPSPRQAPLQRPLRPPSA